jgi:hypothetical protein
LRGELDDFTMARDGGNLFRRAIDIRWCDCRLRAKIRSRVVPNAGLNPAVSCQRQRLTDDFLPAQIFFGQFAIGCQHHGGGFGQIGSGFLQGCALGVGAGQFFDKRGITFRKSPKNSGEFQFHKIILTDFRIHSSGEALTDFLNFWFAGVGASFTEFRKQTGCFPFHAVSIRPPAGKVKFDV